MYEKMETEDKTLPTLEKSDGNTPKKGKILTLLFPTEALPAEAKETKKDKNKPPTKVVIRRLPPRLTKEAFTEEFSPLPNHDYFHFVRGDLSLGAHAFSRAYINFLNQDDIFAFKEKYDDYGIRDDRGKAYHAVVEFAPFQRVPRRNALKKKLSKAGTLESDPKYVEFLQKLETLKNNTSNTSEYFHETESSSLKTKITTTPLLEFLKQKKQKKIDLKNEIRQRKREAEKERKRKEDEKRKADRDRRKEEKGEKKGSRSDEKIKPDDKSRKSEERLKDKKVDDRTRIREEKKESKSRKDAENDASVEPIIPNDPAILKVVVRTSESATKNSTKGTNHSTDESKSARNTDGENTTSKPERKYSDFRTRLAEEKQRKTFHKRDAEELKSKSSSGSRKGVPDEKGDNYNIGNCADSTKKSEADSEGSKRHDGRMELKETKSKFRYSEQRNRDREYRNQKTSDLKKGSMKVKNKTKDDNGNMAKQEEVQKTASETKVESSGFLKASNKFSPDGVPHASRRKSLELNRDVVDGERKRSKSFHDVSNKTIRDKRGSSDSNHLLGDTGQSDDVSKENDSERLDDDSKKDPRVERRIRNKDRPSIEIYRPGMGKFSKQRLEQKKEDTSPTETPQPHKLNSSRVANKTTKKVSNTEPSESKPPVKNDETKTASEVRTMTFTRSGSKEN